MPSATPTSSTAVPCLMQAWGNHHAELQRWLTHRLSDATTAQDLLQDVFLKALRQGGRFCSVSNAKAWLFEVARNTLTDHLRRLHPSDPLPNDLTEWPMADADPVPVVDQLTDCLIRVLTELSPQDADILRQCDLNGQKQADYAAAQGLTLSATKARLRRAREHLRQRMVSACRIQLDEGGAVADFVPRPCRQCPP